MPNRLLAGTPFGTGLANLVAQCQLLFNLHNFMLMSNSPLLALALVV